MAHTRLPGKDTKILTQNEVCHLVLIKQKSPPFGELSLMLKPIFDISR